MTVRLHHTMIQEAEITRGIFIQYYTLLQKILHLGQFMLLIRMEYQYPPTWPTTNPASCKKWIEQHLWFGSVYSSSVWIEGPGGQFSPSV